MFLCICNVMHHCMSMSCHICDECHMDNLSHAFNHASWTIILHAYNFQLNTDDSVNTFRTHILTVHQPQQTSILSYIKQQPSNMLLQNQVITTLALKANCGIYNAHKKQPTQAAPNRFLNWPQKVPQQPAAGLLRFA